ncbi:transglutaminase-like cysteine peptidase [Burkholderiaceae bacterium DAT-1]|nr:transglutaminase-like cysteine peptidase [Burkholderiaceae bacterium DAT-1]
MLSAVASLTDFSSGQLSMASRRWGPAAVRRLYAWQEMDRDLRKQYPDLAATLAGAQGTRAEDQVLKSINTFMARIPYYTDWNHWGVEDYWSTPFEFVGSNGGDCEDYVIAKYFSLKEVGMPVGRMRLANVRALRFNERHMVLAYYSTPDADPLILDNLTGEDIRPASQRNDLEVVYMFNDDDFWDQRGQQKGVAKQIRLWQDLQRRIDAESKL